MTRPKATRAEAAGPVVSLAVPVVTGLLSQSLVLGLAVAAVSALGFLLWIIRDNRITRESPLVVDLEGDSAKHEHFGATSYRRIRVFNRSPSSTVRNVRVELEKCEQQNATFYPVLLQRMHAGEPHPFDLDPGAHVYIDLVSRGKEAPEYALSYDMRRLPSDTSNLVKTQPLDLVVGVTGNDVPKVVCRFAVSVDKNGVLHVAQR
jgi:hypothetical protein